MLSAFLFAVQAANGPPATAIPDFYAGLLNGYSGQDVHALVTECFTPDQEMADEIGDLFEKLKAKDFDAVKEIVKSFVPKAESDASLCMSDPKYKTVYEIQHHQEELLKKVKDDSDWQLHLIAGLKPHFDEIKGLAQDAANKYQTGDYYGAGQDVGKVDGWVLSYYEKNGMFLQ